MAEDHTPESAIHRAVRTLFSECGLAEPPHVLTARSDTQWSALAGRAWRVRERIPFAFLCTLCAFGSVVGSFLVVCGYMLPLQSVNASMPVPWSSDVLWSGFAILLAVTSALAFRLCLIPAWRLDREWKRDLASAGLVARDVRLRTPVSGRILEYATAAAMDLLPSVAHRHVRMSIGSSCLPVRMGNMEARLPDVREANFLGWMGQLGHRTGHQSLVSSFRNLQMLADELIVIGNMVIVLPRRGRGTEDGPKTPGLPSMLDLFLPGWQRGPVARPRTPERVS
jgi:hypothetical protein